GWPRRRERLCAGSRARVRWSHEGSRWWRLRPIRRRSNLKLRRMASLLILLLPLVTRYPWGRPLLSLSSPEPFPRYWLEIVSQRLLSRHLQLLQTVLCQTDLVSLSAL